MTSLTPELRIAAAVDSVRMAGLPVTDELREMLRQVAYGEITAEEAQARLLARYVLPCDRGRSKPV